jgi:hypothetical protein
MPLNIASATYTYTFPGNALVRSFKVWARAGAAGSMKVTDLGQVRSQPSALPSGSSNTSVVVDFGAPLTVGGAATITGKSYKIVAVYKWQGNGFDVDHPAYLNAQGASTIAFPDVSTSRLQLELQGTVTDADAQATTVQLPSVPADLEVHVNDGPAVWRYPGPRGADGVDGWAKVGADAAYTQHEVDLTAAVAPLVGDPDKMGKAVSVTVELRARVGGKLEVALEEADYDLLERVPVVPEPDLVFEQEGDQTLYLQVPNGAATALKEVWVTLAATPSKERAVPAVGPQRVTQVALLLDSGRSATARFPEDALGELTALRLPLSALDGTAEVRAQLLSPVGTIPNDEPGPPMEGAAATKPVQLEPPPAPPRGLVNGAASNPDEWVLLPFDKPVSFKGPVWIQLQVTRGLVRWSLGVFDESEGQPFPVRRGSPTGPWLPLPQAVTSIAGVGGRLHAIGHAPKASPIAPLQLQIQATSGSYAGEVVPVTPGTKSVTVKLLVNASGVVPDTSWLRVISRAAATVTVSSLLRVVTKP